MKGFPRKSALLLVLLLGQACATTAADVPGQNADWLVAHFNTEKDEAFRLAVVREMGQRGDPMLLPYLCGAMADRNPDIRQAALDGLLDYGGALDDKDRDQAYLLGIEDRIHSIRTTAVRGLRERFDQGRKPSILTADMVDLARNAVPYLVRLASVRVLGRVEGHEIDDLLMDVARTDENAELRRAAVQALGARGLKSARQILNQLRNQDSNEDVRIAAEKALGQIGGMLSEHIIAVMPFDTESKNSRVKAFAIGLQDFFSGALAQSKLATVVERRQITRAVDELVFQDAYIDDGKAVEIGKLLRANQVITGTVQLQGNEITVIAKRVDVVSGAIVQSIQTRGRIHDIGALQEEAAHELVRTFN